MGLSYPKIKTELPGKKARMIMAKDKHYCSSSYIKEYPLVIERGEGAMVEDVDGSQFLDFMAGIAVNVTGYSHPGVVEAVKKQCEKFFHICSTDFYYASFSNLAERLARITPISGEKSVFLTNSGSEAVDTAIKLARYHTRRPYIVAFMTEQLRVKSDHHVLEIGTGSGYQAAILSQIVDSVYTIEIIPELADQAKQVLRSGL